MEAQTPYPLGVSPNRQGGLLGLSVTTYVHVVLASRRRLGGQ